MANDDQKERPLAERRREELASPVQQRENELLESLSRERERRVSTLVREMVLTTIDEVRSGLD